MKIIVDPHAIPESDYPFIVSKGGGIDPLSRLIRWRTNSWCEHSMLAINPGKVVWESASSWYGEGDVQSYMTPNTCLKYYAINEINPQAVQALRDYVSNRIASPWYHKLYDWVGIMGQAVGLPKIHTPGLEYCSVDAIHALKAMAPALGGLSQKVLEIMDPEENPGYLDMVMNKYNSLFTCKYMYQYGAISQ